MAEVELSCCLDHPGVEPSRQDTIFIQRQHRNLHLSKKDLATCRPSARLCMQSVEYRSLATIGACMFAWLTVEMSNQICVLWHTHHGQVSQGSPQSSPRWEKRRDQILAWYQEKETNRAGYSIQKFTPDSSETIQSITLALKVSAVSPHWKLVERRCCTYCRP